MKRAIQDFFDLYLTDLTFKHQLLSHVKHAWVMASGLNFFSWLDKNDLAQCEWALNNLPMYAPAYRHDANPISDKYGAFIAMTDVWNVSPDQKELLAWRMRDEWEKFSKNLKQSEKKSKKYSQANIDLTPELKPKFEYIKVTKRAASNADVLRCLIEEEYDRLHNSKQGILPLDSKL